MRVDELESALRRAAADEPPVADRRAEILRHAVARRRRHRAALAGASVIVVVGSVLGLTRPWGSPASDVTVAGVGPVDSSGQKYETTATVSDDGSGAKLCLFGVLDSLPVRCGDTPITDWDWEKVTGERSEGGITWGRYTLIGTYHDGQFTVTKVSRDLVSPPPEGPRTVTPCPPDQTTPDPASRAPITEDALTAAIQAAAAAPDAAGAWRDSGEPTTAEPDKGAARKPLDPNKVVLNAAFTGELETHRQELQQIWGGRICVIQHRHRLADLERIKDELTMGHVAAEVGLRALGADADEVDNVVRLDVVIATDKARSELDRRYGPGVVRLVPALRQVASDDSESSTHLVKSICDSAAQDLESLGASVADANAITAQQAADLARASDPGETEPWSTLPHDHLVASCLLDLAHPQPGDGSVMSRYAASQLRVLRDQEGRSTSLANSK